jgi:hypothetical protein
MKVIRIHRRADPELLVYENTSVSGLQPRDTLV